MQALTTFNEALTLAKRKEDIEVLGELEDRIIETVGKTSAKQIKSISANLHAGEDMAKNTAGAALKEKTPVKTKAGAIDPDSFKEFQKEMGPEVTDVAMEELINRYTAWQLFTQVYEDRSKVKEEIIKKFRVTTKKVSGGGDAPSFCSFCKKSGHSYQGCEELKTRCDNAARSAANSPLRKENAECWSCFQKGHLSSECPKKAEASASKDKKKAPARRAVVKKKSTSDEDEDTTTILYSYAAKKVGAKAAKRKHEEEPVVEIEVEPRSSNVGKKKKMAKKNSSTRTPDPDLVDFLHNWAIPYGLSVRHGAKFGTQMKRVIQAVYKKGQDYHKAKNPVVAATHLSHAMVVSGCLGNVCCDNLVVDPGSTTTILDIKTAHKAHISIRKGLKYVIQMANSTHKSPFSKTAERETIIINGIEASLRMLVMDSKGSYNILLGRNWLHAVNAVGDYKKNQYTITNKGKQAILAGKVYTTREVELSSAAEESGDSEDELSEEEEEGEEEEEDEEEEEKTKNDAEDEEPVLAQSFRACVVSLDELDLKVVGSRPSPPSPLKPSNFVSNRWKRLISPPTSPPPSKNKPRPSC